ncbi:polysaccharide deacetylase family protein [Microbulbifer sp. SSSA007]|uniref:polysaccharide deacetylase family protein n=1 Tax=Microbulbifer sp. SSSA007 TaxID=3243379 RepID=UPI004039AC7C
MQKRDLIGYAGKPPHPQWPDEAQVAVQFVLNVEEGSESTLVNGDGQSESYLHEISGRPPRVGERDFSVESMYEYGARAGVWRLLNLFEERRLKLTAFATGLALELNPKIGEALSAGGHEVAGHGYRWLDYKTVPVEDERQGIRRTIEIIKHITGCPPRGWYTGRTSLNTRKLLNDESDLIYISDSYCDDLPYWQSSISEKLIIPYTLVNNDMRYLMPNGFSSGQDFFLLLKDAFDCLWKEGKKSPKLMSIGLHGRISGHPARAMAIARFLDYIITFEAVWICRREDVAKWWISKQSKSNHI